MSLLRLKDLPAEISGLKSIEEINVMDNPDLKVIPPEARANTKMILWLLGANRGKTQRRMASAALPHSALGGCSAPGGGG